MATDRHWGQHRCHLNAVRLQGIVRRLDVGQRISNNGSLFYCPLSLLHSQICIFIRPSVQWLRWHTVKKGRNYLLRLCDATRRADKTEWRVVCKKFSIRLFFIQRSVSQCLKNSDTKEFWKRKKKNQEIWYLIGYSWTKKYITA